MNTGNAHQSKWSQDFHAGRGATSLPCPVADLGGHPGTCKEAHPRGAVIKAGGGWYAMPPFNPDDMVVGTKNAHDL